MEQLVPLSDGRIVSFGTDFNAASQPVNMLRIFRADGSGVTADAVDFGAGTPVGEPFSDYDRFVALQLPGGGIRVIARQPFDPIQHVFDLDASGNVVATSTIDASPNDATVPYYAVLDDGYVVLPNGTIASLAYQDLFLSDANGLLLSATRRGGTFESVNDGELIVVGTRLLRVSHVNSEDGDVEIRAQFYTFDGSLSGPEILVADGLEFVTGHWDVEVTLLTDGRIAIAYAASRPTDGDTSESAVFLTLLNANGTVSVPEQVVNTDEFAGAQDWVNVWPLQDGGVAVSFGTETGFTPDDSINVRFFNADGVQYHDFQQKGQVGREAGDIHVSLQGVVTRLDVAGPTVVHDAPGPNDPGLMGGELVLSRATPGELAQDGETATLADGRVVVVYDDGNLTGVVRILDPATATVNDVDLFDLTSVGGARELSVAALRDGGFVVAWVQGDSPATEEIHFRIYDADGSVSVADTLAFDGAADFVQVHPTQWGFLLAYVNEDGAFDNDGTVRFFTALGTPVSPAFEYHDWIDRFEQTGAVDATLLPNGTTVMSWNSLDTEIGGTVSAFGIFLPDGSFARTLGTTGTVTLQNTARVALLPDVGFVTVDISHPSGAEMRLWIDSGGPVTKVPSVVKLDVEALLSPADPGNIPQAFDQVYDIEINGDGQLVMAYVTHDATSQSDVRYAIFELDGTLVNGGIVSKNLSDHQSQVELTRLPDGNVLLTFTDETDVQSAQQSAIKGVIIQGGRLAGPLVTGDRGPNVLDGATGTDTITGNGGADSLSGFEGFDILVGEARGLYHTDQSAQVYRMYDTVFGREPDGGGHHLWTSQLIGDTRTLFGGTSLNEIAAAFVASPEFQRTYGGVGNAEFVTLLYQNVLDRVPSDADRDYWVHRLETEISRDRLVVLFSESPEHVRKSAVAQDLYDETRDITNWGDEVYRLYGAIFDRVPDGGGFNTWTAALAGGTVTLEEVTEDFMTSPEFQSTYGDTTNAEFVTLLYQNVLDRTPSQAETDYWVGRIDGGEARARVVLLFAESPENLGKTRSDMVTWMQTRFPDDVLDPGPGDAVVSGGAYADTFVFTNDGEPSEVIVTDVEAWDTLDFGGFGLTAPQVLGAMTQVEEDVVFRLVDPVSEDLLEIIVFKDTRLSAITEDMILV